MEKQSGVIPYRRRDGRLEVLLVTSSRGRWIIPKGNINGQLSPRESALKEAYEEAGVRGRVHALPVGTYAADRPPGYTSVEVFLMEVQMELQRWPEAEARERLWVSLAEAHRRVDEDGLRALLLELAELMY